MEPVDINSKELQELKSEYNDLKETLNKQRIVNQELLEQIRKQKTSFIGKDLTKRMSMDIITIPMIIVICHAVGWPIWFAVAVSIWALIDLVAVLVGRKKFDTRKMLDDDVLTAAKTVKEYKRFYHLSVVVGAIPAVALVAFVLIRIYTESTHNRPPMRICCSRQPFISLLVWLVFCMLSKRTGKRWKPAII